jgi:hypothetical protein
MRAWPSGVARTASACSSAGEFLPGDHAGSGSVLTFDEMTTRLVAPDDPGAVPDPSDGCDRLAEPGDVERFPIGNEQPQVDFDNCSIVNVVGLGSPRKGGTARRIRHRRIW